MNIRSGGKGKDIGAEKVAILLTRMQHTSNGLFIYSLIYSVSQCRDEGDSDLRTDPVDGDHCCPSSASKRSKHRLLLHEYPFTSPFQVPFDRLLMLYVLHPRSLSLYLQSKLLEGRCKPVDTVRIKVRSSPATLHLRSLSAVTVSLSLATLLVNIDIFSSFLLGDN